MDYSAAYVHIDYVLKIKRDGGVTSDRNEVSVLIMFGEYITSM